MVRLPGWMGELNTSLQLTDSTEQMGRELTEELDLDPPTPATPRKNNESIRPENWPAATLQDIKQVLDEEAHRASKA